jgi:hypothetical protein
MSAEKRENPRFKWFLPADLMKSDGKNEIVKRASICNLSETGLKLHLKLNIKKGSHIKLKVYFPEKEIFTPISAEVTWIKNVEDNLEAGLKITEMDVKTKKEILDWIASGQIEE